MAKPEKTAAVLTATGPHENAAREIARYFEPVACVYLRLDPEGLDERALQVRHTVEALTRDGASSEAIRTVREHLARMPVAPVRLALFVDQDGTVVGERHLPGTGGDDRACCTAPPDLLPLLECDQERPPFVGVLIDRTGADLVFSAGGAAPDSYAQVIGTDDEIEQHAADGWAALSQSRFERRAVDSWQHNAHEVAQRVEELAGAVQAQAIVVAGDHQSAKLFTDHLTVGIGTLIVHNTGSRSAITSHDDRAAWLARALHEVATAQTQSLLAMFHERLDASGLAVEGVQDTLAALAAGRVATLLIDPARVTGHAWFGARGMDVFSDHEDALSSGLPVRSAPVVDIAVRSTLLTGGRVRVLPPGDSSAPIEGIGALCRFGL